MDLVLYSCKKTTSIRSCNSINVMINYYHCYFRDEVPIDTGFFTQNNGTYSSYLSLKGLSRGCIHERHSYSITDSHIGYEFKIEKS